MQGLLPKALRLFLRNNQVKTKSLVFGRCFSIQAAPPLHITRIRRKSSPLIVDGSIISELDPESTNGLTQEDVANRTLEALEKEPYSIRSVHERYIKAGASVIRTSNQFAVPYLLKHDLQQLEHLTTIAGRMAWEGREATCSSIQMPPISALYETVHKRLSKHNRFKSSIEEPLMSEIPKKSLRRTNPSSAIQTTLSFTPSQPKAQTLHPSSQRLSLPPLAVESFHSFESAIRPDQTKERMEYYYNGHRVLIAGRLPPVIDYTVQSTHASWNLTALQHGEEVADSSWVSYKDQKKCLEVMVKALDPYVDIFICEANASIPQAEMAARAAMLTDKPVWVGFLLKERVPGIPRLASGESITQAVDNLLTHLPRFVDGYVLNNSEPNTVSATLPLLRSVTRRPIGVFARLGPLPPKSSKRSYTNSTIDTSFILSPEDYCSLVSRWVDVNSADIIGGCWGVGNHHIKALAERFNPNACPVGNSDCDPAPKVAQIPSLRQTFKSSSSLEVNSDQKLDPLSPLPSTSQALNDQHLQSLSENGLRPTRFKNFYRMVDLDEKMLSQYFAKFQRRSLPSVSSEEHGFHQ